MTDRFSQEMYIRFKGATDPWPLAADALTMVEAAYGPLWKEVEVEYGATTLSDITFDAEDLPTLNEETSSHGAALRDVVIHTSYWDGDNWFSANIYIWPRSGGDDTVHFDIKGPLRVEVEAFVLSVQRSVAAFAKRKRWSETKVELRSMSVSSRAKAPHKKAREPLIRASGLKPRLWRWFVRNRDTIIIGLTCSLLATIAIIILQLVRVIPVPQ